MAFASAAELATLLQQTFTAEQTAAATLLLDLSTAAIRNYTRQTISQVEDDVVLLRTTQRGTLVLPERPATEVSLVRLGTTTVAAASYLLVDDELRWGATALNIGNLAESDGGWGSAAQIEVTYTHGFAIIPDDIKGVCLSWSDRRFSNPGAVRSEQVGPDSIEYVTASPGSVFTDDEKQILNRYRRRAASLQV